MKKIYTILIIIGCLLTGTGMRAQTAPQTDELTVSLLTCGPGAEVYNLFGHSAIRIKNEATGVDYVFNYGIFSFNTSNFVLRFTLGETDYELGVQYYEDFVDNYRYQGRWVHEQVLNLTPEERLTLTMLLEENYRPENRIYRYNYFYDNCATRPRDMVEKAVSGCVVYAEDMESPQKELTYRGLVHQYTQHHAWSRFGIDLCLGSEADKPISRRAAMFIPFLLEYQFGQAQKVDLQGEYSALVSEERVVVPEAKDAPPSDTAFTPLRLFLLLFILAAGATIWGIRQRRSLWGLDLAVFFCAGVAGCILAFLAAFSEHPAVSPNYLLAVFHPLHLIFLPWMIRKVKRLQRSRYMVANAIVVALFIIFWAFIPQKFPLEVLPLALILLIRSCSNLILSYRKA